MDLKDYDIEVSAALFKVFIRELPVPLIGLKLSEDMGALPGKTYQSHINLTLNIKLLFRCKYLYSGYNQQG